MANYYGTARSNYFRVNDEESFNKWADECGLEVYETKVNCESGEETRFCLIASDDNGWPEYRYDEEKGVFSDFDLFSEIADFLHKEEVAVFMEIGSEKARYLIGSAVAVNAKGETRHVNLNDIYDMVKKDWNIQPTLAEY